MSRPKFFRDPIHVQLRFEPVNLDLPIPEEGATRRQSWLLRKLIDTPEFQRLRLIRQNGLANMVFHGAEHSRFSHSMGVMYLAKTMYNCLVRNMGESGDQEETELAVVTAALLHDIGHGPFSHTIEEVLNEIGVDFHHETLTVRFILEDGNVNHLLRQVDPIFPDVVSAFIDKTKRNEDHWSYKIVSSQLDADRLDYLQRDAYYCGLKGHGFDHPRILDLLIHHEGTRIGVDIGALEAVESYLVALDQLYRAIYYHHAVRAANRLLTSVLKRAVYLSQDNPAILGPAGSGFRELTEKGERIALRQYARLGEHQVWALIDGWRDHEDPTLADLSTRLIGRRLLKTISPPAESYEDFQKIKALHEEARAVAVSNVDYIDEDNVDLYVCEDGPNRTSYKTYDWKPESANESIWIMGETGEPEPLEECSQSKIVQGLKQTKYFPRLIMPYEVRELLRE